MPFVSKDDINIYCPICDRRFSSDENGTINAHIDECLNVEVIKEIDQKPAKNIHPPDRAVSSSNTKELFAKSKNTKTRKSKITKKKGIKPLTSYFTSNLNI